MRITIEMTEAEGLSAANHRTSDGELAGGRALAGETAALDGGPPPEGLLLALGATASVEAGSAGRSLDGDAGGPPAWLVGVLSGGADQSRS
jgi:hypothetical protein